MWRPYEYDCCKCICCSAVQQRLQVQITNNNNGNDIDARPGPGQAGHPRVNLSSFMWLLRLAFKQHNKCQAMRAKRTRLVLQLAVGYSPHRTHRYTNAIHTMINVLLTCTHHAAFSMHYAPCTMQHIAQS